MKIYLVTLEDKGKELKFYVVAKNTNESVEKIIKALNCEGIHDWSEDDLKTVEVVATQYADDVFE